MSQPTKADRWQAIAVVCTVLDVDDPPEWAVEYVAAALADERDKARAPFLALADEYTGLWSPALHAAAAEIRHAAQDQP